MLHLKSAVDFVVFPERSRVKHFSQILLSHYEFRMNQHLQLKKYFPEKFLTRSTASIPVRREIIKQKHEF